MFEPCSSPLLPRAKFYRRLSKSFAAGVVIIGASLAIGMLGYHHFEQMGGVDASVNAAMILSGEGPLAPLHGDASKIFAGCFALYSGFALVSTIGIIFVPVFHRFLHRFHLEKPRED